MRAPLISWHVPRPTLRQRTLWGTPSVAFREYRIYLPMRERNATEGVPYRTRPARCKSVARTAYRAARSGAVA